MSSYAIVAEVSEALRHLLWTELEGDEVIEPIVGSEEAISFRNPTETARDSSNRLSLWLYHITENEFVKNQPPERGESLSHGSFPPLGLNLYYLVTPFAISGKSDHLLLGKVMQVFYDNAIVLLRDGETAEELRLIFCRTTLEELTRVWEALREPYRLSLCYQVRVLHIDSEREVRGSRIIERSALFNPETGERAA